MITLHQTSTWEKSYLGDRDWTVGARQAGLSISETQNGLKNKQKALIE